MTRTHQTLVSLFDDIADSIREKKGTSGDIVADTFPQEISSIAQITKTLLYETDVNTFSSQIITLLDDFNNYDYLEVYWKTHLTSEDNIYPQIFRTNDIPIRNSSTQVDGSKRACESFGVYKTGVGTNFVRSFSQEDNSNDKLWLGNCNGVNTSQTDNARNIPCKIYGIKVNNLSLDI